jgi:hypothetical protein
MKDCYYDLGLHFILLDDPAQSYILKLRDRGVVGTTSLLPPTTLAQSISCRARLPQKKSILAQTDEVGLRYLGVTPS